ncbi:MAG: class I SAM-dependent methyltransferase, partial [Planctomycetota bacterium]|nr:class I SAM-dependent methyltransferase [Planctomycetota bacterium]
MSSVVKETAAESGTPPRATYENDRYWTQRLEREFNLAGVGHAGVGLAFNRWAYRVRRTVLLRALRRHTIGVAGARLLELGFGTGYYLELWRALGAAHVLGFDITEIAVNAARERFGGAAAPPMTGG